MVAPPGVEIKELITRPRAPAAGRIAAARRPIVLKSPTSEVLEPHAVAN
jgi:hypothetical protein